MVLLVNSFELAFIIIANTVKVGSLLQKCAIDKRKTLTWLVAMQRRLVAMQRCEVFGIFAADAKSRFHSERF